MVNISKWDVEMWYIKWTITITSYWIKQHNINCNNKSCAMFLRISIVPLCFNPFDKSEKKLLKWSLCDRTALKAFIVSFFINFFSSLFLTFIFTGITVWFSGSQPIFVRSTLLLIKDVSPDYNLQLKKQDDQKLAST